MHEEHFRLSEGTHISSVHLIVRSLHQTLKLYRDLLGLCTVRQIGSTVELSASGKEPSQVILTEQSNAAPRSRRLPGLFHVAILFPNRKELANVFNKLYQADYSFQGFADHGVSEALYLADPEGNGIELYCDRPREQWRFKNGFVEMVTEPLDAARLLAQATVGDYRIHPETTIGHIHLQVSDLSKAEKFYHEILRFDVTQRSYPGALFVSAGGYHHHIGLNIWNSHGSSASPANTLGLLRFGVQVPDRKTIEQLKRRCDAADYQYETFGNENKLLLKDFDNIQITISPKQ